MAKTEMQRMTEAAAQAEQERLEGEVFLAVNNLVAHMGCSGFMLPGRINPQYAVYVGEPAQVYDLVTGVMFKGGKPDGDR